MKTLFTIALLIASAAAQTRVTVADTLYKSNSAMTGTKKIVLKNPTMTSPDGKPIPANTVEVAVINGAFSVPLVPNVGSSPEGTFYTATYSVGAVPITEYWVVLASPSTQTLAQVRTLTPPVPSAIAGSLAVDGSLKVVDSGTQAWEGFTLFSTPKWPYQAPYLGSYYSRQFKIGGSDTGGYSAGSNGGGLYLSGPHATKGGGIVPNAFMRIELPEASGGLDLAKFLITFDNSYGADLLGPFWFTAAQFAGSANPGCPSGPGNHVMTIGNNNGYGSDPLNYFRPSWSLNIEANYQPNDCDHSNQEAHLHWTSPNKLPDGTTVPSFDLRTLTTSVTLNRLTNTVTSGIGLGGNHIHFYNTPTAAGGSSTTHTDIDESGNWKMSGGDVAVSLQGKGVVLRATDGAKCFRVTVNNAGSLSTAEVTCP